MCSDSIDSWACALRSGRINLGSVWTKVNKEFDDCMVNWQVRQAPETTDWLTGIITQVGNVEEGT